MKKYVKKIPFWAIPVALLVGVMTFLAIHNIVSAVNSTPAHFENDSTGYVSLVDDG